MSLTEIDYSWEGMWKVFDLKLNCQVCASRSNAKQSGPAVLGQ
jgi:hypothetical protein